MGVVHDTPRLLGAGPSSGLVATAVGSSSSWRLMLMDWAHGLAPPGPVGGVGAKNKCRYPTSRPRGVDGMARGASHPPRNRPRATHHMATKPAWAADNSEAGSAEMRGPLVAMGGVGINRNFD